MTYLSHVCLKVPEILFSNDSKGQLEMLSVKNLHEPRIDTGKRKPERGCVQEHWDWACVFMVLIHHNPGEDNSLEH